MDIVNQICRDTPERKSKPAPRKNNKRKNNYDNRKDDTSPPKQRKRSTPKGKKNVSLEEYDDSNSRNESAASDYVPPTPPDPNRTVSTRTPNRSSIRNRTEPNRIEDNRRKAQKESANELKAPNSSKTLSKATVKSENQGDEENKSLCEPSIPLTCQSFAIIDTAANKMLFEHFTEEWRKQEMYALSIACEKIHVQPGDIGRIGANFNKGFATELFSLWHVSSQQGSHSTWKESADLRFSASCLESRTMQHLLKLLKWVRRKVLLWGIVEKIIFCSNEPL